MDAAVAALRREQILVTRITPAKAKAEAAAKKARRASSARGSRAKNLAVFTRQFSVMIDAGLPLVQCLDILGNQEEDKNFAAVILQTRDRRRRRRVARRRDEEAPEGVRPAVHQHDRGRRGGRHPRHDSQAPGDLHREGRQAEGPGQVGDDLSDRRHRRSRASSSASFCGRSSRRSPSCSPASAPSCRCRRASSSRSATTWSASARSSSSASAPSAYGIQAVLRDRRAGATSIDAIVLKLPVLGNILRKIAVARFCRTLSTLLSLGRADSRRPRHHREDRRQRDHRGRDHDDAHEHRARRDDLGAAQGDGGVSVDGRCR